MAGHGFLLCWTCSSHTSWQSRKEHASHWSFLTWGNKTRPQLTVGSHSHLNTPGFLPVNSWLPASIKLTRALSFRESSLNPNWQSIVKEKGCSYLREGLQSETAELERLVKKHNENLHIWPGYRYKAATTQTPTGTTVKHSLLFLFFLFFCLFQGQGRYSTTETKCKIQKNRK